MQKEKIIPFVKKQRRFIGLAILLITGFLFFYYLKTHPDVLNPIKNIPTFLLIFLLLLYGVFLLVGTFITKITILMCREKYGFDDSLQLTIYSTLVNFFGPLQSGPGFRALYLKNKLEIRIRDYTAVTSVYYMSFLFISLLMLLGTK